VQQPDADKATMEATWDHVVQVRNWLESWSTNKHTTTSNRKKLMINVYNFALMSLLNI